MSTDEIRTVTRISLDGGDWICKCPHCGEIITLGDDPRGEQFQHKLLSYPDAGCKGWLEVSSTAKQVKELT